MRTAALDLRHRPYTVAMVRLLRAAGTALSPVGKGRWHAERPMSGRRILFDARTAERLIDDGLLQVVETRRWHARMTPDGQLRTGKSLQLTAKGRKERALYGRMCIACGCTDGRPCDCGCMWVGADLCSACLS